MDCLEAYGVDQSSGRRHVFLVVDNNDLLVDSTKITNMVLDVYENEFALTQFPLFNRVCHPKTADSDYVWDYTWTCASHTLQDVKQTGAIWVPYGALAARRAQGFRNNPPIRYCYSQRTPEQCNASIVPVFLIIVIICNVIKILASILTLHITKADPPPCTTGDAIQSFLNHPDPHTKDRCLVSKHEYETYTLTSPEWVPRSVENTGDLWKGGQWRWAKAIHAW